MTNLTTGKQLIYLNLNVPTYERQGVAAYTKLSDQRPTYGNAG